MINNQINKLIANSKLICNPISQIYIIKDSSIKNKNFFNLSTLNEVNESMEYHF